MKQYSYYKWQTWSLLALTFVLSLFHRGAMGVIADPLAIDLNASASQIGSLGAITFYTYAFMQIPAGLMLDRFGYKTVSIWGILTTGIGSFLLGLAPSLFVAYFARFLVGFGTSFLFIAALKAQTIWFKPKEFTTASSYLALSGNLGGMLSTFPLAILIGLIGWRFSMVLMALLSFVLGIVIWRGIKSSPVDYGFTPRGYEVLKQDIPLLKTLKTIFKLPALWRNFFALFALVGTTTALSGVWGIQYIETVYGISSEMASFLISFVLFGLIAGSLCINKIVHLFNANFALLQRYACLMMMVCVTLLLLAGQFIGSLVLLAIILFLMGFCAMAHLISFTDIMRYCEGSMISLSTSTINAGEFIGSSMISLIIGFTLDLTSRHETGGYSISQFNIAFLIFFIVALLGFMTSFIGTKPLANLEQSNTQPSLN